MTTALVPAATPRWTQSLSRDEVERHRSQIGFEVEVAFSAYWRPDEPKHVRAGVLADFADALEDWPIDQVRWGLRQWRTDNPTRRPHPEQVAALLKAKRGREIVKRRPLPPPEREPERVIAGPEARRRILEEAGLETDSLKGMVKTFGGGHDGQQ